jgi:lipopolysaccharide transport system ATP-binding protein
MNAVEELCSQALLLDRGKIIELSSDVRFVTTHYLKSDEIGTSEWTNSGGEFINPYFQPMRFCIVDQYGKKATVPLRNDELVYVQLEGSIEDIDPSLTIGYAVFTDSGQILYWSYQTDTAENRWPTLHKGRCILRGKLPAHLLNEGRYRLELIGGLHFRQWLFEPGVNAPSISVEIQGGLSESPYWMLRRPGLLAPIIEWDVMLAHEEQGT